MAEYTYIVDPGGTGDYNSITSCITGTASGKNSSDIVNIVCKRTTSAIEAGNPDPGVWYPAGMTLNIVVHPDYRHDGYWSDTNSKGNYNYISPYQWYCSHTGDNKVDGLLMDMAGTDAHYGFYFSGAGNWHMKNIIIRDTAETSSQRSGFTIYTNATAGTYIFENCICYGIKDAAPSSYTSGFLRWFNQTGPTALFINCLAYDCTRGFADYGGAGYTIRGCISLNCMYEHFSGMEDVDKDSGYNVSSPFTTLGTFDGRNSAISRLPYESLFVNPTNGDFRPRSSSKRLYGVAYPPGMIYKNGIYGRYDILGKPRRNGDIGPFTYDGDFSAPAMPSKTSKYVDLRSLCPPTYSFDPNRFPVWRVKPPLGTPLDRTKSWFRDLRYAMIANQDGTLCGNGLINLVTGVKATPSHGDQYLRRYSGGISLDTDGREWTTDITPSSFGEQMTIIHVYDTNAEYDYPNLTNNPHLSYYGNLTAASRSSHDGTQYYATVERGVTTENDPKRNRVLIGVIDFATQTSTFYTDGVEKVGTMEYGPDPTIPNLAMVIEPRTPYATIHAIYYWSRCLTPAECRSITANPWQLFKAPLLGGAGPLVSGPNYGDVPIIKYPVDGSTGLTEPVVFSWLAYPGAQSYQLQVSTNPNFTSTALDVTGITATTYSTSDLSSDTTYYWRIRAIY